MREWQPIETAPKDGTRVILFVKCGDQCVAGWNDDFDMWQLVGDQFTRTPTHWMPLPEPPHAN